MSWKRLKKEKTYLTNDGANLKYTPPGENPEEKTLEFPDPSVKGYLGELEFIKTDDQGADLAGAEFTLTHNSDCPVCGGDVAVRQQVVSSDAQGKVSFTRIPSGHEYTLTETKAPAGYKSNTTEYPVVVSYGETTVNGNTAAEFAVVNEPANPVQWQIKGLKTVADGMSPAGYTFRMTNTDRVSEDVTSDADGVITFPEQEFTAAGTYGYEIREVPGNNENVIYDSTIYYIQVTVAQNGDKLEVTGYTIRNAATGEFLDVAEEQITFHNVERTPVDVNLVATKVLSGDDNRKAADGEFIFELKDADGNVIQTKTNSALLENNITFDKLTFDAVGTYTYTITEKIPADEDKQDYMTYDETVYTVTVTVTAPENSTALAASVTYSAETTGTDKVQFNNVLKDEGYVNFSFTKYAQDASGNNTLLPGATFVLTHQENCCDNTIAVQRAASDASGVVTFSNVPSGHTFILTEETGSDGNVTVGETSYQPAYYRNVVTRFGKVYIDGVEAETADSVQIINIPLTSARVVLQGVKTVERDNKPYDVYDGVFHFVLQEYVKNTDGTYSASGVTLNETNMMSANDQGDIASRVIFDPLFFQDVGSHYYTITETPGTYPGMNYDGTTYYVTVYVEESADGTHLLATVGVSKEGFGINEITTSHGENDGNVNVVDINFNNILRVPTSAQLEAVKTLDSGNDVLTAGAFTFQLKDQNGNILQEKTNDEEGKVTFDAISYDAAGTHTYTISEKVVSGDSVIFDTKSVDVTVTVTETEESYAAQVKYGDSTETPTFTNAYKGQLIFLKKNEGGTAVGGAGFALKHAPGCGCNKEIADMTATSRESDGRVMITNIPSGHTYILAETTVPHGYVQAPDHIVEVNKGIVTVKESDGTAAVIPEGEYYHVITNYPEVVIYGDKVLAGRDLAEDEFQFKLEAADANFVVKEDGYSQTVTNAADGLFAFHLPLTNKSQGATYYYVISEVKGTLPGVTYTDEVYRVTVSLDKDMKATITYDKPRDDNGIAQQEVTSGILFENTYDAQDVEVTFSGTKTMTGKTLNAHEFLFQLYSTDGTYTVSEDATPIQTVHNAADGTYSFSSITYRGAGIYHYVIKEFQGALGGVTYDPTEYQIEVVVTDNTEEGKLEATVTVNGEEAATDAFHFNNGYTVSGDTEAVLSGTKTLEGRTLNANEFAFQLNDSEGNVVETVKNAADGSFTFNKLTFDTIGEYTYSVVEELPAETADDTLTYDNTVYTVTIHVYDNGVGGLGNSVSYSAGGAGAEGIHFTNKYAVPGQMNLGGTKTFNGGVPGETYSFSLIRLTDNSVVETVTSDKDGKFYFCPVEFTSIGTYQYKVVEEKGSRTDVIYDPTVYYVTAEVTKENDAFVVTTTIQNVTTGAAAETITFNNTYRDPAVAQLKAKKTLEGKVLEAGEFEFELRNITHDETGVLVETVANDASGNVTFRRLTFNQEGTYRYRITEKGTTVPSEDAPYMVYDETIYEVEIVVEVPANTASNDPFAVKSITYYNGDEALTGEPEFKNSYVDQGTADFSFTKVDEEGNALPKIQFELVHEDHGECTAEIETQIAIADDNGIVSFEGVPSGHYYILKEIDVGNDGNINVGDKTYRPAIDRYVTVSYQTVYIDGVEVKDASSVTIVNYPKADARVALEGVKTLDGGNSVTDNAYTFNLVECNADGTVMEGGLMLTEHNITMANAAGELASRIVFDPIDFSQVGTYYYTITEAKGSDSAIVYDNTVYYVTVVVASENDDDNLEATVTVTTDGFGGTEVVGADTGNGTGSVLVTGLHFNNTKRKPVSVTLEATKVMSGTSEIPEGFTFLLKNSRGIEIDRQTNNADGKIIFETLTFEDVGTHTYTIEEVVGGRDNVVYDTTVHNVQIVVTEQQNGDGYDVSVTYDGGDKSPIFTNRYDAKLILMKKDVDGAGLEGAQFTLTHACEDCETQIAPMTATSRADGYLAFTGIPSGHTYVLEETGVPEGYIKAPNHIVKVVHGEASVYEIGSETPVAEGTHSITNHRYPEAQFEGTKTLNGLTLTEDAFQFQLKDAEGNLIQTVSNDAEGKFVFDAIRYTQTGTYAYTISEVEGDKPYIDYDETVYEVTVEVKQVGNVMTAEVAYAVAEEAKATVSFTNTYKPVDTQLEIPATKELTGRDMTAGEFTFSMQSAEEKDGKLVPIAGTETITAANEADGKVTFTISDINAVGVTYYIISEDIPENAENGVYQGVTYDTKSYHVRVEVNDNEGTLEAKAYLLTGNNEKTEITGSELIVFHNEYKTDKASAEIVAKKELSGRDIVDGEFTFELYEGEVKLSETTNNGGEVKFAAIDYNEPGTHTYTVKEVKGDRGGVTYDEAEYEVVVIVADDGAGKLVATVTYPKDGIVFKNSYKSEQAEAAIEGTKTLEGRDLKAEEFEFELKDVNGEVIGTARNDAEGKFAFNAIEFTTAGTYTYTVNEKSGDLGGVIYDNTVYTIEVVVTDNLDGTLSTAVTYKVGEETFTNAAFTNEYYTEKISATIKGTKTLEGRALKADEFEFELKDTNGEIVDTARNDAEGKFAFNAIEYTTAGTYTYTVNEKSGNLDGVNYDTTVYNVTVTVTDNGAGKLVATVTYPEDGIVFENTYEEPKPEEVKVTIDGVKVLEGRDLAEGEFSFVLMQGADEIETVTNNANGSFSFSEITYTEAGEYVYTVHEVKGNLKNVVYDETVYTVTVSVTETDGKLVATVTYPEDGIVFENTYEEPKPEEVKVTIDGVKVLEGRNLAEGEFSFVLMQGADEIETVTNNANGSFSFSEITYTEAGEYVYTVHEVKGDLEDVEYDETVYTVRVSATEEDGVLTAVVIVEGAEGIVFINRYEPEEPPTEPSESTEPSEPTEPEKPDDTCVPVLIHKTVINKKGWLRSPDGFQFQILDEEGSEVAVVESNGLGFADYSFHFTMEDVGKTFTYTVREINTGEEYVEYSDMVYTIQITILLDENLNKLIPVTTVNGVPVASIALEFVNIYDKPCEPTEPTEPSETDPTEPSETDPTEPSETDPTEPSETDPTEPDETEPTEPSEPTEPERPDDIWVPALIHKTFWDKRGWLKSPDGFQFQILDESGNEVAVVTSNTLGYAEFGFAFTAEDAGKTFTYTVREINAGAENVEYSDREYTVQITILLDETLNALIPVVAVDGVPVATIALEFVNIYDEPDEPTEPTDPTEPSETTEPTEPSETTEPTEPSETTEPTEPSETTEPTEPSETTEPTEPSETTEPTEPSETTEPTEPSETTEPTKPSETTEPSEETTEPEDTTKPPKPTKPSVGPGTGDNSNIHFWFMVMMISGTALTGILFTSGKKGKYLKR